MRASNVLILTFAAGLMVLSSPAGAGPYTRTPSQREAESVAAGVREQLRAPAGAVFGPMLLAEMPSVPGRSVVCGSVNAQNGYGGYAGSLDFVGFIDATDIAPEYTHYRIDSVNESRGVSDLCATFFRNGSLPGFLSADPAPSMPGRIVTGEATALAGDQLKIGDETFYLVGIDSVRPGQTCSIGVVQWPCGEAAKSLLNRRLRGAATTCVSLELSRYGLPVAQCKIGSLDLQEFVARSGYAVSKSSETGFYALPAKRAAADQLGIWRGRFDHPDDYRSEHGHR